MYGNTHASRGIARLLNAHGYHLLTAPASFLVSKEGTLLAGEDARAHAWGALIGEEARSASAMA
jgi:hypothetical protein